MSSTTTLIVFSIALIFGNVHGGYLSAYPTTTLAVSSPLISRSFLPTSPYLQYSALPQNLLTYASYGSILDGSLTSQYVAAPAYYKYAYPSYVQAAPAVYLNPGRTIIDPAMAEEVPEAKEATPEEKEVVESVAVAAGDSPQDE